MEVGEDSSIRFGQGDAELCKLLERPQPDIDQDGSAAATDQVSGRPPLRMRNGGAGAEDDHLQVVVASPREVRNNGA
jgi:hypothetical protein